VPARDGPQAADSVGERVRDAHGRLTPAERKVAVVVVDEPQVVAFGTVAEVAARAGTSGPSVVRLAARLGYAGFGDLQTAVQGELARRLPPAATRIRQPAPTDVAGRVLEVELANLQRTFAALAPDRLAVAVDLLADTSHGVWVLPGEAVRPVGFAFSDRLEQLRPDVSLIGGSEVRVRRQLATARRGDVLVAFDLRRYERWLIDAVTRTRAPAARLAIIAVTDGPLSPLAAVADVSLFVDAVAVGPFDSLVAATALTDVLVASVAERLRNTATDRLDTLEQSWGDALLDE